MTCFIETSLILAGRISRRRLWVYLKFFVPVLASGDCTGAQYDPILLFDFETNDVPIFPGIDALSDLTRDWVHWQR